MSIKNVIKSQDFFSSLNEEQVDKLASISTLNSYSKEYILHYESRELDRLIFLIEGLVKAYKIDKHGNEIFLYYVYKNNMLSEVSDLKSKNLTSYSNMAFVEDSQILSIDYQSFKSDFLHNNLLCLEFSQEVILRSQKLESLINREFIFDSVAKVSMMLHSDLDMFNKLKRHDISLILHIQPATLSRVLNRLKRNKIIDIIHGKVIIMDFIALKDIFGEQV